MQNSFSVAEHKYVFIVLGMYYFGGQFSFPRCCVDQLIVRSIDQYHQHSYGNLQTVFKNELLHITRYNQIFLCQRECIPL